jgi:hypothetical protein
VTIFKLFQVFIQLKTAMKLSVMMVFMVVVISLDILPAQSIYKNYSVQLRIISIGWPSKEWQNPLTDTTYIEVNMGENFGARNAPHYFKLLDIIDQNTLLVQFSDELVVVGEPIAAPSKRNPITIASDEEICFRTRLYDGGTDYCIGFWHP